MKAVKNSTEILCDWVCNTGYGDIKTEVRQETLTMLYDTVGGMIASATLPTCQPVVDMVKAMNAKDKIRWISPH